MRRARCAPRADDASRGGRCLDRRGRDRRDQVSRPAPVQALDAARLPARSRAATSTPSSAAAGSPTSARRLAGARRPADRRRALRVEGRATYSCPCRPSTGRHRRDLVASRPDRRPRAPRPGRAARPCRVAGGGRELLDALPEDDRALWATAFYAGLRRGEFRGAPRRRCRPRAA